MGLRGIGIPECSVAAKLDRVPRAASGERGISRYFMITVRAFDPDRILGAISGKVSFIFTRWFVFAALSAIAAAGFVAGPVLGLLGIWAMDRRRGRLEEIRPPSRERP